MIGGPGSAKRIMVRERSFTPCPTSRKTFPLCLNYPLFQHRLVHLGTERPKERLKPFEKSEPEGCCHSPTPKMDLPIISPFVT
jgi:hypothetical protein